MKRILNYTVLLALCALVVLPSCNKDDDDELLEYLEGTPYFEVPVYAAPGDILTLNASGITTEGAKYSWSFPGLDTVSFSSDTTSVTISIPDSLDTFTISLSADAGDDYYSTATSRTITVIGEGTLTGIVYPESTIVDPRDSNVYPVVKIGNLEWFAKNLNWDNGKGEGYAKTDAAANVLGRLYTWEDATGGVSASGLGNGVQGVCPDGWSIPTNEDWIDLAKALNGGVDVDFAQNWEGIAGKLMVNAKFNGDAMWAYSPKVEMTNDYKWNAIPAGSCQNDYNNYMNLFDYGFWWSSTERDSSTGYYRYIYEEFPNLSVNYAAKNGLGASVRCVRVVKE